MIERRIQIDDLKDVSGARFQGYLFQRSVMFAETKSVRGLSSSPLSFVYLRLDDIQPRRDRNYGEEIVIYFLYVLVRLRKQGFLHARVRFNVNYVHI